MNTLDVFLENHKTPIIFLWLVSVFSAMLYPCAVTIVLGTLACLFGGYNIGYLLACASTYFLDEDFE